MARIVSVAHGGLWTCLLLPRQSSRSIAGQGRTMFWKHAHCLTMRFEKYNQRTIKVHANVLFVCTCSGTHHARSRLLLDGIGFSEGLPVSKIVLLLPSASSMPCSAMLHFALHLSPGDACRCQDTWCTSMTTNSFTDACPNDIKCPVWSRAG